MPDPQKNPGNLLDTLIGLPLQNRFQVAQINMKPKEQHLFKFLYYFIKQIKYPISDILFPDLKTIYSKTGS